MLIGHHKRLYPAPNTTMTVDGNGTSDSIRAGHLIVYGTNLLPGRKLSSTTNIRIERATP